MPIYEYECRACGKRSEAMQRMADPPLTTCAECGGELKKLISSPAFQFKGSGWYVTDYARAKPESKEGKAEGEGASKSGDGAGETKAKAGDGGEKGEKKASDAKPASSTKEP
jgi:putative FmdB family regulatory protein